jgi:hypothetical protein
MEKKSLIVLITIMIWTSFVGQTNNKNVTSIHNLKTSKYAGVYQYGISPEKGPTGMITIYPESDDTILFFLDISRGAPSYNMGNMYDRVKIKSGKGVYFNKFEDYDNNCKFSFIFSNNTLVIKTIDNSMDCGFGGNVFADGKYKKTSSAKYDRFTDMTGKIYYFSKTKPADYEKILK